MKLSIRSVAQAAFVVAIGGIGVTGYEALTTEAVAARPAPCPQIYAPVICDNGKIYPNQCEADRKRAKGCVPYPWI